MSNKKLSVGFVENNKTLNDSEVWMHKKTGELIIVHPLFAKQDDIFHAVGFCIDDNKSESLPMINLDLYSRLKGKCVKIGDFCNRVETTLEYSY